MVLILLPDRYVKQTAIAECAQPKAAQVTGMLQAVLVEKGRRVLFTFLW